MSRKCSGIARFSANSKLMERYQDAQLPCLTMLLHPQRNCSQRGQEMPEPQLLASARQHSLILQGPAGGRMGTGGGCGRDLAPGPGMATGELALTSEMKVTL